MIAVLLSFEAIDIVYTENVGQQQIVLSQPAQNTFAVIKQGKKIQLFLEHILSFHDNKMEEEQAGCKSDQLFFVCFSTKSKKVTQDVFKIMCPKLENRLIYYNIDKNKYSQYSFNRPLFANNQICFGEGFSQLRAKEQLRISLACHLKCVNLEYIFIQKNMAQIKQLKKQGYTHIVDQFDLLKFSEVYQKAKKNLSIKNQTVEKSHVVVEMSEKHAFAAKYIQNLYTIHKQINVKTISPFPTSNLTIEGMINQLFVPSIYYNISPKSWISNPGSRQIVSYVFHNLSDQQLYIAKTARPKDFSNQQDFQIKVLTYYLTYLINPKALCVPHDKNATLIKFSKIKVYQNKKAFLNIRPYIQGLKSINQLDLKPELYYEIFTKGSLNGCKVHGVAGLLLFSILINQNLNQKTLSEQTALVSLNGLNSNIYFINKQTIHQQNTQFFICRTDYHNVFNMSNYKIINNSFIINRQYEQFKVTLQQLSSQILQQMCDLIFNIHQQTFFMIKNLFIYYRWNTKLIYFYDLINFRLNQLRQILRPYSQSIGGKPSLLFSYPRLACLLIPQSYQFFILPPKDNFFPYAFNVQQSSQSQRVVQNPYLSYMNKPCSFAIFKSDFPSLTFLQWIKSTSKYQIIQYMSMINKTLEQFIIMDKRLKLSSVNDKKNAILIIDHAQLCLQIINKPKGVKTVMIYRLKKPEENEDVGLIGNQAKDQQFMDQSEDELIKVLTNWGSKLIENNTKLQLFDWVLQSFIRIKSEILNLSINQAKKFLLTLHKDISTNKHRLKELQQNHRKKCNFLYTMPVIKIGQKIQLKYHIFEYLHIKILFSQILQNRWNCRLQTYQNGSVILYRPLMDIQLIYKVVRQIMCYLRQIDDKKLAPLQSKTLTSDCLQLLRSLTQNTKNQAVDQQIRKLNYQVFSEIKSIKNYNSIQHCIFTGDLLCVVGQQFLELMDFDKSLTKKIENTEILAISCQNSWILMLNFNRISSNYFVQELIIKNQQKIQCQLLPALQLQSQQLINLLTEKKYRKVKIQRLKSTLIFIFQLHSSILIIALDPNQQSFEKIKQFAFSQPITQVICFTHSTNPYLLCATLEQVVKIDFDSIATNALQITLLSVNFGISSIFATQTAELLHVFLYKLHVIEHYIIVNNQVISKVRYQLNRNTKTLTFYENLLYMQYQNDDSLAIFRIKGEQIQKISTYYWVQPNAKTIYPKGDSVFLKSWNYIKQIRLHSSIFSSQQMSDK